MGDFMIYGDLYDFMVGVHIGIEHGLTNKSGRRMVEQKWWNSATSAASRSCL